MVKPVTEISEINLEEPNLDVVPDFPASIDAYLLTPEIRHQLEQDHQTRNVVKESSIFSWFRRKAPPQVTTTQKLAAHLDREAERQAVAEVAQDALGEQEVEALFHRLVALVHQYLGLDVRSIELEAWQQFVHHRQVSEQLDRQLSQQALRDRAHNVNLPLEQQRVNTHNTYGASVRRYLAKKLFPQVADKYHAGTTELPEYQQLRNQWLQILPYVGDSATVLSRRLQHFQALLNYYSEYLAMLSREFAKLPSGRAHNQHQLVQQYIQGIESLITKLKEQQKLLIDVLSLKLKHGDDLVLLYLEQLESKGRYKSRQHYWDVIYGNSIGRIRGLLKQAPIAKKILGVELPTAEQLNNFINKVRALLNELFDDLSVANEPLKLGDYYNFLVSRLDGYQRANLADTQRAKAIILLRQIFDATLPRENYDTFTPAIRRQFIDYVNQHGTAEQRQDITRHLLDNFNAKARELAEYCGDDQLLIDLYDAARIRRFLKLKTELDFLGAELEFSVENFASACELALWVQQQLLWAKKYKVKKVVDVEAYVAQLTVYKQKLLDYLSEKFNEVQRMFVISSELHKRNFTYQRLAQMQNILQNAKYLNVLQGAGITSELVNTDIAEKLTRATECFHANFLSFFSDENNWCFEGQQLNQTQWNSVLLFVDSYAAPAQRSAALLLLNVINGRYCYQDQQDLQSRLLPLFESLPACQAFLDQQVVPIMDKLYDGQSLNAYMRFLHIFKPELLRGQKAQRQNLEIDAGKAIGNIQEAFKEFKPVTSSLKTDVATVVRYHAGKPARPPSTPLDTMRFLRSLTEPYATRVTARQLPPSKEFSVVGVIAKTYEAIDESGPRQAAHAALVQEVCEQPDFVKSDTVVLHEEAADSSLRGDPQLSQQLLLRYAAPYLPNKMLSEPEIVDVFQDLVSIKVQQARLLRLQSGQATAADLAELQAEVQGLNTRFLKAQENCQRLEKLSRKRFFRRLRGIEKVTKENVVEAQRQVAALQQELATKQARLDAVNERGGVTPELQLQLMQEMAGYSQQVQALMAQLEHVPAELIEKYIYEAKGARKAHLDNLAKQLEQADLDQNDRAVIEKEIKYAEQEIKLRAMPEELVIDALRARCEADNRFVDIDNFAFVEKSEQLQLELAGQIDRHLQAAKRSPADFPWSQHTARLITRFGSAMQQGRYRIHFVRCCLLKLCNFSEDQLLFESVMHVNSAQSLVMQEQVAELRDLLKGELGVAEWSPSLDQLLQHYEQGLFGAYDSPSMFLRAQYLNQLLQQMIDNPHLDLSEKISDFVQAINAELSGVLIGMVNERLQAVFDQRRQPAALAGLIFSCQAQSLYVPYAMQFIRSVLSGVVVGLSEVDLTLMRDYGPAFDSLYELPPAIEYIQRLFSVFRYQDSELLATLLVELSDDIPGMTDQQRAVLFAALDRVDVLHVKPELRAKVVLLEDAQWRWQQEQELQQKIFDLLEQGFYMPFLRLYQDAISLANTDVAAGQRQLLLLNNALSQQIDRWAENSEFDLIEAFSQYVADYKTVVPEPTRLRMSSARVFEPVMMELFAQLGSVLERPANHLSVLVLNLDLATQMATYLSADRKLKLVDLVGQLLEQDISTYFRQALQAFLSLVMQGESMQQALCQADVAQILMEDQQILEAALANYPLVKAIDAWLLEQQRSEFEAEWIASPGKQQAVAEFMFEKILLPKMQVGKVDFETALKQLPQAVRRLDMLQEIVFQYLLKKVDEFWRQYPDAYQADFETVIMPLRHLQSNAFKLLSEAKQLQFYDKYQAKVGGYLAAAFTACKVDVPAGQEVESAQAIIARFHLVATFIDVNSADEGKKSFVDQMQLFAKRYLGNLRGWLVKPEIIPRDGFDNPDIRSSLHPDNQQILAHCLALIRYADPERLALIRERWREDLLGKGREVLLRCQGDAGKLQQHLSWAVQFHAFLQGAGVYDGDVNPFKTELIEVIKELAVANQDAFEAQEFNAAEELTATAQQAFAYHGMLCQQTQNLLGTGKELMLLELGHDKLLQLTADKLQRLFNDFSDSFIDHAEDAMDFLPEATEDLVGADRVADVRDLVGPEVAGMQACMQFLREHPKFHGSDSAVQLQEHFANLSEQCLALLRAHLDPTIQKVQDGKVQIADQVVSLKTELLLKLSSAAHLLKALGKQQELSDLIPVLVSAYVKYLALDSFGFKSKMKSTKHFCGSNYVELLLASIADDGLNQAMLDCRKARMEFHKRRKAMKCDAQQQDFQEKLLQLSALAQGKKIEPNVAPLPLQLTSMMLSADSRTREFAAEFECLQQSIREYFARKLSKESAKDERLVDREAVEQLMILGQRLNVSHHFLAEKKSLQEFKFPADHGLSADGAALTLFNSNQTIAPLLITIGVWHAMCQQVVRYRFLEQTGALDSAQAIVPVGLLKHARALHDQLSGFFGGVDSILQASLTTSMKRLDLTFPRGESPEPANQFECVPSVSAADVVGQHDFVSHMMGGGPH